MTPTNADFYTILQLLHQEGVRFVVIGGFAMYLQGADYFTVDIDISFARDRENTDALAKMLASQNARLRNFPPDLPFILDGQTLRNNTTITLETQLGLFDLLAEPEGVDGFEGLWERANVLEVDGNPVRVACITDLIAMKRAANRPKDQDHIRQLEALQKLINS